jgi:hypothetical protein
LAHAMGEALRAPPEELARMGERGRKRVLEQHDLARQGGELASLFERVMRTSPIA